MFPNKRVWHIERAIMKVEAAGLVDVGQHVGGDEKQEIYFAWPKSAATG